MKPVDLDTTYTVQPEDTLSQIAQQQLGDQQKWRQIRRADGTRFEPIDHPNFGPRETVYCTLKIGERSKPGYGTGEDFTTASIPDSPLTPFERQVYEFLLKTEGLNPLVNRQIVEPLLEHFLAGKAEVYQQGSNTALADLIENSKPFKTTFAAIELQLHRQLQAQVLDDHLQPDQLHIIIPQIAFKSLDSITLFAAIGGIQGADLLLKSFQLEGTGRYSAQLWIVLYDDFGLDQRDRYTPGLIAAWNLQHRGSAQAFIHEVVVAQETAGNLILPAI
ncbi:MAG: LysM peptidoglycan-binding domain-containing protein [Oscillatoriales cyanobacterium RM2_1_1]|nr:LysM peptidoglycan-binding domain-containing protein [Oscillatoriales cyanobacterium SM2_3_0]NJO47563.1 LysM peptidoglycan-binding domain-containing protein [Oscillatoriales cyanobacterium RM2_1_1]